MLSICVFKAVSCSTDYIYGRIWFTHPHESDGNPIGQPWTCLFPNPRIFKYWWHPMISIINDRKTLQNPRCTVPPDALSELDLYLHTIFNIKIEIAFLKGWCLCLSLKSIHFDGTPLAECCSRQASLTFSCLVWLLPTVRTETQPGWPVVDGHKPL